MKSFSDTAHNLFVAFQMAHDSGEEWKVEDHCQDPSVLSEFWELHSEMGYDKSTSSPELNAPLPPNTSRYLFQSELSRGGMGIVYSAYDNELKRDVAIKVLRRSIGTSEFRNEAEFLAKLDHPNIVPIHDIQVFPLGTTWAGQPFIVMKLIQGETLENQLTDSFADADTLPQHISTMEQVARTVGFAHSKRILHRDLKPHNVMIDTQYGSVHVIDFGIAKLLNRSPGNLAPPTHARIPNAVGTESPLSSETIDFSPDQNDTPQSGTQPGGVRGTYSYMAPEQLRGQLGAIQCATDVYALGAMLLRIVIGQPPMDETAAIRLRSVSDADFPKEFDHIVHSRLQQMEQSNAPETLRAIIRNCLAITPESRYGDARALANALQEYQQEQAKLLGKSERRRRMAYRAAGFTLVLLLLSMATLFGVDHYRVAAEKQRDVNRLLAEKNADLAQENDVRAQSESKLKTLAEVREQVAKLQAAELAYDKGLRESDLSQSPRGAAWMLRAGELAPAQDPIQGAIRANIAEMLERSPRLETVLSFKSTPTAVAFDANSSRLFIVGSANSLQVWDAVSGKLQETVPLETGQDTLALHPNGKILFLGGLDGKLSRFDISGERVKPLVGWEDHDGAILTLGIHPMGTFIASGGADGRLIIRDLITEKIVWDVKPHGRAGGPAVSQTIRCLAFNSDGSLLATGGYDGAFVVADWLKKKVVQKQTIQIGDPVWRICWLQAEQAQQTELLVTGCMNGRLTIWNMGEGKPFELNKLESVVTALLPQPGRTQGEMFVAGLSQKATLLSAGSGSDGIPFEMSSLIQTATWNRDGSRLAIAGQNEVHIWNTDSRMPIHYPALKTLGDEKYLIGGVAFDSTGRRYAITEQSDKGRVWIVEHSREKITRSDLLKGFDKGSRQCRFSPDGQNLLIGFVDGTVELWRCDSPEQKWQAKLNSAVNAFQSIAFSPNGQYWAAGQTNGAVQVGETRTGKILGNVSLAQHIPSAVCFDSTGQFLIVGTMAQVSSPEGKIGKLHTWKWKENLQVDRSIDLSFVPTVARLSPDTKSVLIGGLSHDIEQYDLSTLNTVAPPVRCTDQIKDLAFDRSGTILAVALKTGAVQQFHWPTKKSVGSAWQGLESARAIAFTDDNRLVLGGAMVSEKVEINTIFQRTHPEVLSDLKQAKVVFEKQTGLHWKNGVIQHQTASEYLKVDR